VLIAPGDLEKLGAAAPGRDFIVTPNPYAEFARVAQMFIDLAAPPRAGGGRARATGDAAPPGAPGRGGGPPRPGAGGGR
ncbi:hypothetical protein AAHH80_39170, partial [Burkholderia pseudomallei]